MMADELGFALLPADDEGLSPAQARAAAVAGALAEPEDVVPQAEDAPVPLGRTWVFDFAEGRFVYSGGAPAPTSGAGAVQQWVLMAMHSARLAHKVFSDNFGMEDVDRPIGELTDAEIVADYEQHLREAVLVHERVTALDKFTASIDRVGGVLNVEYLEIVTDEQEVLSMGDITLSTPAVS
jgi:hypothetical protein